MPGMFALHDEKEKDETTVLIGEGPDFIGLVAKFSREAFKQIGGAGQRMQCRVKHVEFEGIDSFKPNLDAIALLAFPDGYDRIDRMVPRFCVQCGQMLHERLLPGDHRTRHVCPACGHVAYENAKPCAGVLPTQEGRVLLARRAVEPYLGCWDIIGGFMEHDETPEAAALREASEETGLTLALGQLLGVYHDVYGSGGYATLNVYFIATVLAGHPQPCDDVAELAWFPQEMLPTEMAFPQHTYQVLTDWIRWTRRGAGF